MTYGFEVVIPLETGFSTLKTSQFSVEENNHLLSTSLDLIDKRRKVIMVTMAHYQYKLRQGYDKGVKVRPLAPRDLVLRKIVGTAKNPLWGKLEPNETISLFIFNFNLISYSFQHISSLFSSLSEPFSISIGSASASSFISLS